MLPRLKNNFYYFKVSDDHWVYKYDLTINLFGYQILTMWKPTKKGKEIRDNYLSFRVYKRSTYKLVAHVKL